MVAGVITNGDGIDFFINGKIVVPSDPTAAEKAAAKSAARLGFGSTGLTPRRWLSTPLTIRAAVRESSVRAAAAPDSITLDAG